MREGAVRHVVGYGHFGDGKIKLIIEAFVEIAVLMEIETGNLHLNIVADQYLPEIQDALEPFVYELVCEYFKSRLERGLMLNKNHSELPRFCFSRAWHWIDENWGLAVLEGCGEQGVDEEDKESLRRAGYHESRKSTSVANLYETRAFVVRYHLLSHLIVFLFGFELHFEFFFLLFVANRMTLVRHSSAFGM